MKTEEIFENTMSIDAPLFGVEKPLEKCGLVIIPAPWEATTSFKGGTSFAPQLVREASHQMDYFHEVYPTAYQKGIFFKDTHPEVQNLHDEALKKCDFIQSELELPVEKQNLKKLKSETDDVNDLSKSFNDIIYSESKSILEKNKIPAVFGGDHSTPYGLMKALSEKYEDWSILHFDAHLDLRVAYQGFEHSHASILYNASQLPNPPKCVSHVGVRDFAKSEFDYANKNKHHTWSDKTLKSKDFEGQSWVKTCGEILKPLSKNLYISFDVDGLDPQYCPDTGTPVPGGLSYNQACKLIELASGQFNIIGFDLVEVSSATKDPESWDLNVGVRLLFELCLAALNCKP